ncbi:MAG: head GIN domain-containing protein [Ferruginibacter sp.]
MKKLLMGLVLLLFQLNSHAQEQFVMDENASLRTLTESFDKITVSNNIKLIISQGVETALAVSASQESFKAEIKTEVKDGILNIFWTGDSRWNNKSKNPIVYLSFKEIQSIEVSGASSVNVMGVLALKKFNIALSGASKFSATLKTPILMMDLSGSSKANLLGNVNQLNIECSGASDVNGYDLIAETADVKASGASDIMLSVVHELNAEASGASHIYYKGKPMVTHVIASGVSKIVPTN